MLISDKELTALLSEVKTIAIIGAKDKPSAPVDHVGRYLIEAGYNVIPVHPKRLNVWGLDTYPTINDIPVPIDIVDLFRAAQFCPGHADEFLKLESTPRCFWMQSGIFSPESRNILDAKPVTVIEDRCIMVEHKRLGIGAK